MSRSSRTTTTAVLATHPEGLPATSRRNLAGLTGAMLLLMGGVHACTTAHGAPASHPDETLIRLGEQLVVAHRAEQAAWAACEGERDDDGPLTTEARHRTDLVHGLAELIEEHAAMTPAGLVVKLRAALACHGSFEAWERESNRFTRLLASAADDLAVMDVTMAGPGVRA